MTSYFNGDEKLGDSSIFVACKFMLDIIADNNDVLDYIQGKVLVGEIICLIVSNIKLSIRGHNT